MIKLPSLPFRQTFSFPRLIRRSWRINRSVTVLCLTMAGTAAVAVIGLAVDSRLIVGVPAWAKSTKFAFSMLIYGATLLWMLPHVTRWRRPVQLAASVSAQILILEMALIVVQALRGEAMHFNVSTPLNEALFGVMGASITLFWLLNMGIAGLLLFQRLPDRALAWGIRLALLVSIVGMGEGWLMIQPTAEQRVQMEAGQRPLMVGGHTVGAVDEGEPGLPFLGWSTEHGDLRVAHFVGLHGLQALSLLGWWIGRRKESWLGEGHRVALVFTGAGGYLGLVGLLTWQALRAQPLIRPDLLTLGALAGLAATTTLAAAGIVIHAGGLPPLLRPAS